MVPRGVARQHLGDEEQFVASTRDGVRDDGFGVAVHLGGVDMGHAALDAALERRDRLFAVAAVEIPGALPDHGDVGTVLAEWFMLHDDLRAIVQGSVARVSEATPGDDPHLAALMRATIR